VRAELSGLYALALALTTAACSDTKGGSEPAGDGSEAVDVTPSGGEGCVLDGRLCLEVPAGAVHEAIEITVVPVHPGPTWAIDDAFRLEPVQLRLHLPAKVTYRLAPEIAASVRGAPAWLGLERPSEGGELLFGERDDDVLTADVPHFGVLVPSVDVDRDGYPDVADLCPDVPGAQQSCPPAQPSRWGVTCDRDCDGLHDLADPDDDGDGVEDRNDNCRLTVNPGQEVCSEAPEGAPGLACDKDCDGLSSDDDTDSDGVEDERDNCVGVPNPSQAACGRGSPLGLVCDRNCNALIDSLEGLEPPDPCTPGDRRRCGHDEGECMQGEQDCGADDLWGPCEGEVAPSAERCNGLDDDCNGETDEGGLDLCPLGPHVTSAQCDIDFCHVVTCETGWSDDNGRASDGCENPMQILSMLAVMGSVSDLAAQGSYLYAAYQYGLLVHRKEEGRLVRVAWWVSDSPGVTVAVEGAHAFLSTEDNGLRILDVSDPAHPHMVGAMGVPPTRGGIGVVGRTVYLCGDDVYAIDVADRSKPRGRALGREDCRGIATGEGRILLLDRDCGLSVFEGEVAGEPLAEHSMGNGGCSGLVLAGDVALATTQDGIRALDLSVGEDAVAVALVVEANRLVVGRSHVFGCRGARLTVVAVDPEPRVLTTLDDPGLDCRGGLAYLDGLLFLSRDDGRTIVVSVADPARPSVAYVLEEGAPLLLGGSGRGAGRRRILLQNDTILLGRGVFSVTDDSLGLVEVRANWLYDVAPAEDQALLATNSGIELIEIADGGVSLLGVGARLDIGNRGGITWDGGPYAYARHMSCNSYGCSGKSVIVVQVHDGGPSEAADLPWSSADLWLSEAGVIARREGGLSLYDVSGDPLRPVETAHSTECPDCYFTEGLTGADDLVVVPANDYSLHHTLRLLAVDAETGFRPLATAELPDAAQDIALADGLAFVATGTAGLVVLDISEPASPRPYASVRLPGSTRGVSVEADRVAVSTSFGLALLRFVPLE